MGVIILSYNINEKGNDIKRKDGPTLWNVDRLVTDSEYKPGVVEPSMANCLNRFLLVLYL